MSSRTEIIEELSQHTSANRRDFIRTYGLAVDYPIEFRGRTADKTADSHGDKDGRPVTFLAQDGSYPELPYFTDESFDHVIGKSLDTGLGAANNRLKAVVSENSGHPSQSEGYKERREKANRDITNAAFILIETGEIGDGLQEQVADTLREFLARSGNALSRSQMHTAAGNFVLATALNTNTALERVHREQA